MLMPTLLKALLFVLFTPALVVASDFKETLRKIGQASGYYLTFIKVYDASLYISGDAQAQNILKDTVSNACT